MRIEIDPGHGGHDNGAAGTYLLEKSVNLLAAGNLVFWLHQYGHEVKVTRKIDEYISLADRVDMANKWPADLFISLHCNGFKDPKANGIEVFSYPGSDASEAWAARFQNALVTAFPDRNNRGTKNDHFFVLRETKMPAVLIEMGFITNSEEEQWLDQHYTKIAHVIADELGNIKKAKVI